MLSLRLLDPLGLQRPQGADQLRAGPARLDHVVDVAALGRRVGVGEVGLVVVDQLLAALVGGGRGLQVAAVDDVDRSLGPITATSAVGQAKLKSASMCFEFMTS